MKILKLHIENFGKLTDFSCQFNDGLNQFVEENGWGKSTLATFINSMFYGLEASGRKKDYEAERSKYSPWQGGIYGGNLTFETKENVYTIYRTFGKTPEQDTFQLYNETLKQISQDFSENIGEELFGVGKETFSISSFFGQAVLGFGLTDEAVSNLAGLEKFKNDAESVDKALNLIEKRRKELVANPPKKTELIQISKSLNNLSVTISLKESKAKDLKETLSSLQKEKERLELKNKIDENERKNTINKINEQNFLQQELNQKNLQLNNILLAKNKKNDKKNSGKFSLLTISLCFAMAILFVVLGVTAIVNYIMAYVFAGIFAVAGFFVFFIKKSNISNKEDYDSAEENRLKKDIENLSAKLQEYQELNIKILDKPNDLLRDTENKYHALLAKYNELLGDLDQMKEETFLLEENKKNIEEIISQNEKRINLLKLTANYLNKARENVSQRFVNPVNEKFQMFLSKFLLKDKIDIDSKFVASIITNIGAKNIQYLSKGSQDLVAICQRFSMIENIFKKEKPFVVLDDSFVNVDDSKINSIEELIKLLTKTYQILYFTCSESRKFKK